MVRVFLGRNPNNGKRRYLDKTVRGTKKDTRRYLNGVLRDIDLGIFVEPSLLSVDDYLDKWLETMKAKVSPLTAKGYGYLLANHVRPALGAGRLASIRPLDLQTLYARMQSRGASASLIRHVHATLYGAFAQAVKWRSLQQNAAALVELPRLDHREMSALAPDEALRFLEAAATSRHRVLFTFALVTGMRPNEYRGLQWRDIDLQAGTAKVRHSVQTKPGGGWYVGKTKTPRARRSVPLPDSLIAMLGEHWREQAEQIAQAGDAYEKNDLVFASSRGTPINIDALYPHFRKILTWARISTAIRIYDLRHSHATLLLAARVNPKIVAERLGQASIYTTLDVYSHVLPTMQQAAALELEKMLFRSDRHTPSTQLTSRQEEVGTASA
jgi:integrase